METGLVQILEGALLAAGEPLSVQRMTLLFEENERPTKDEIKAAIESVEEREGRGYELVHVASGYRFQVRQDLAQWVGRSGKSVPRDTPVPSWKLCHSSPTDSPSRGVR